MKNSLKADVQSAPSAECGVRSAESKDRGAKSKVQRPESKVQGSKIEVRRSKFSPRPAAADYLSRFLCLPLALALLATGCAGPRALKGGRATITHKPSGTVEQTLMQSENPAQATKQDQESVKVRTYTVPAGSQVEQSPMWEDVNPRRTDPSTLNSQPSTLFTLSAPMPVVERDEQRTRTTLGPAQRDTAREMGAKLSSLKPVTLVGVILFVAGLASLVWPPLKAIVASATTSAAFMIGGLALVVVPTLVVGNTGLVTALVALGVGGWALAHRHGELRGRVGKAEGNPVRSAECGARNEAQPPVTSIQ